MHTRTHACALEVWTCNIINFNSQSHLLGSLPWSPLMTWPGGRHFLPVGVEVVSWKVGLLLVLSLLMYFTATQARSWAFPFVWLASLLWTSWELAHIFMIIMYVVLSGAFTCRTNSYERTFQPLDFLNLIWFLSVGLRYLQVCLSSGTRPPWRTMCRQLLPYGRPIQEAGVFFINTQTHKPCSGLGTWLLSSESTMT